jgi:hypothetical protein
VSKTPKLVNVKILLSEDDPKVNGLELYKLVYS